MTAQPQPQHQPQSGRSVAVGGDIRDSILVLGDNNVLEVALGNDAILRRLLDEGHVRMQRRTRPRTPPPPPFADRVGRDGELAAVAAAASHVNIHGTAGIGKTYVLLAALGDDVTYVDAAARPLDDVLQAMCEELFDCEPPLVFTPTRRRHELREVDALVALDDVRLVPQDAQRLLTEGPRCRYVTTSRRRVLAQSTSVRMTGLPEQAALELLAAELGRALAPAEQAAAGRLTAQLGGHPLMLRQAAGLAADTGIALAELVDALETPEPVCALSARLQAALEPEDRALLAQLAVTGHAPLGTERVAELTGQPDAAARLEVLEARGLVQSHSPRYSLVGALAEAPPVARLHELRERAAAALASWAESATAAAVVDEAPALLSLLRWAHEDGRQPLALRLARALDRPLALGRRWGAWLVALQAARDGARAAGDSAAEAWALHQLGTREYALGDAATAVNLLEQALDRRETIGDEHGAAVTRHNLAFIRGDRPPPALDDEPPSGVDPRGAGARGVLALVAAIVALALGAVVAVGGTGHGTDSTPPTTTTTDRHDHPPAGTTSTSGGGAKSPPPTDGHEHTTDDPKRDDPAGDVPPGDEPADPGPGDVPPGDEPGDPGPGDVPPNGEPGDPGPGDVPPNGEPGDPGPGDVPPNGEPGDPGPGDVPPNGEPDDPGPTDPPAPHASDTPPAGSLPDVTQEYGTCVCDSNTPPPGPR